MDSQQAREVLSVYRPGRDDPSDPQFAEALAQAQRDPELALWLERHSALDDVIRRKFSEVPVPASLEQRILAGGRASQPVLWWRKPAWLAAAAVVFALVVAGVFWWQQRRRDSFLAYEHDMVRFVSKPYTLDFKAKSLDEAQQTVARLGWPSNYVVPPPLLNRALEGGCTLQWHNRKVTLICWSYGYSTWMFVVDRATLPDSPSEGSAPQLERIGDISFASWTRGDKIYIVAAAGDVSLVRTLL